MKFVSIDIETSSLDPNKGQIIELAAVIEDTDNIVPIEELPSFNYLVKHDYYNWDVGAYKMNKDLFQEVIESDCAIYGPLLFITFCHWLSVQFGVQYGAYKFTIAGKNVASFDLRFISKLEEYKNIFHHRTIDPSMYFVDWTKDKEVPNLKTCLERAGLDSTVKHRALGDARQVIELLRTRYVK